MKTTINTALITGGNGNLGRLVADKLLGTGVQVVKFDIPGTNEKALHKNESIVLGDMRDTHALDKLLGEYQPDTIYHLASLLSGSSEADHTAAWEINATGSFQLLQLAVKHGVRSFFFAGTNASYGGKLPEPLAENTEQWPENLYGATKVAVERLGVFFKHHDGLDFRCLRFPMVLSPFAPPTAVTAYPSHAFKAAVAGREMVFPVAAEVGMSTIFLDDVIQSIIDFSHAPVNNLTQHAYNLHSYFLSTQMVIDAVRERYPDFEYRFEPNATVERLIANWPDVIKDDYAIRDWGWRPAYDFAASVNRMFDMVSA